MFYCNRSVLTCRTCEQRLSNESAMPGWGWGAAKLLELRIWNFLNGNSCLFKMYSDFILFFNWWMSIFSHVLIVMSGTSLVPYGFAVLNSCLVIAASAVISPCTALLNVDLSCSILYFFWVFLSGWRWLLHLFVNPQNISVLGKMMPFKLIWDLSPVLDSSHSHSNFCLYN